MKESQSCRSEESGKRKDETGQGDQGNMKWGVGKGEGEGGRNIKMLKERKYRAREGKVEGREWVGDT